MNILLKPVITEKMTQQGEDLNRYGFVVPKEVNKIEVKAAVEEMYGVTVKSICTMIMPSKKKSRNTKSGVISGKIGSYKKAVVTLNEGEIIDFYSNI
jgi:large subunit ribosomal protein L23|tara:strand:- start:109 stop:399 length:291 start_codon:yes stop_codon:yes gene_type:complete